MDERQKVTLKKLAEETVSTVTITQSFIEFTHSGHYRLVNSMKLWA